MGDVPAAGDPAVASLVSRLVELDTGLDERERGSLGALLAAARSPAPPRHVEITVKATRLCNLRCTYCEDWRSGPGQVMSDEVVEHLIRRALGDPTHDAVSFGWHGGEPLVLPIAFYERALALQDQYRRPGQQIRNGLQTNAVLVTDEWARFLRERRFSVGVSIDGPPEVHDRVRRSRGDGPTYDAVMAGLERLRANDVAFGVLVTVDHDLLEMGPDAVLDFLVTLGAEGVGLNARRPAHDADPDPTEPFLSSARMNELLIGLDDARRRRGITLGIREIDSIATRLDGRGTVSCRLAGSCIGSFFVVEPNGDIAHCSRFGTDERYRFGNVVVDDFARLRRSVRMIERRTENAAAVERRRSCPDFDVCQGGCPSDRAVEQRHDPDHDATCCGRRPLIAHLRAARSTPVAVGVAAPR